MDRDPDECPISREQARIVWEQLGPSLRYLGKLRTRMERTGFPPTGRMYLACCEAYNAVHTLYVHFHYASCDMGKFQGHGPPVKGGERRIEPGSVTTPASQEHQRHEDAK